MEELLMGIYTRDRTKHLNVITSICIFNLINTCCLTFSQPSAAECILQLGKFSVPYNVRDEGGNWGSFLNDETCGGPFRDYLYAMGIRANKTGQMYLNSTQQTNCLTKMNDEGNRIDAFGCGIEKLTKTGGSCSNFSVNDANIKLGDKLRKLSYNCQFQDTADKRGHLCESCVNSWKDIKEMKSKNDKYTEAESDICRFAVLVSLTSTRITDQAWLRKLYNCLSNQKQPVNFAHTKEKEQEEEEHSELTEKHKFRPVISVLIGGILAVLITVFISVWAFIRKRANVDASEKKFAIDLPKDSSLEVSIEEVYSATNNLNESNFIGEGTAGRVYRGVLPNNQEVAIKHITHEECIETFLREVKSLTNVRHPNLVALLGYSKNAKECFLIYEICPYGNLSQWLFANNRVLSWTQRLEIAIDSAKGLLFLHTYHDRSIIHRDIKPTNILLGQNFEAKLSDFGLSKVIDIDESYMISEVRGTYGYIDPEYETNHHVNSAGDVYSFGIVLLQILSGRKVINMNIEKPTRLDKIAKSLLRERRAVDFVDPKLHGDYSTDAFQLTLELAISCIAPKQQRPSIENVVDKLEEALAITRREKASTPHSTPVWSSTSFQEQYRTIVENVT
ncbi:hypothetical protein KY290_015581 [Solanum tuberosum]|uniref:Protein kinase domain-containing protein n=1 Tax=Solanum tuberosum TaxID=4113 RepID=A0ABQ7VV08_SOLTU|nr:PREDICTED: probable receptor-like protein kinase At5g15080 [Solanum tuberosum]KAH0771600.1 hypothetical protein KY290_015581 [Solanum tuberosum]